MAPLVGVMLLSLFFYFFLFSSYADLKLQFLTNIMFKFIHIFGYHIGVSLPT